MSNIFVASSATLERKFQCLVGEDPAKSPQSNKIEFLVCIFYQLRTTTLW